MEFKNRQWIKRVLDELDPILLVTTLLLSLIGFITIFSATYESGTHFLVKQAFHFGIAFVLMCVVAKLPPQQFMRIALPLYLVGLILLLLVFVFGIKVNGARRWLPLGFARIQPSEIMKLAVPLLLAWYFHKYAEAPRLKYFAIAFLLTLIPVILVAKQPDLGTALLIGLSGAYVIFLAGFPWKLLIASGVVCILGLPLAWQYVLHDYQKTRVLTLLDPSSDPLGAGYHIIQSTIAIGSGGVLGKGFLNGSQTQLKFIPERHTDFIFAVFAEEWGFAGSLLLLVLYLILIVRGLAITASTPTVFGHLLAGAVTLSLFSYVFVNIGMVSGILPVVGVPLPLISYGGTALVIFFVSIGMLMHVQINCRKK